MTQILHPRMRSLQNLVQNCYKLFCNFHGSIVSRRQQLCDRFRSHVLWSLVRLVSQENVTVVSLSRVVQAA